METASYIQQIDQIAKLTREEELAIALKARAGNRTAINELVRANMRYVIPIAISYRRYGIPVEELIAEGNVGLMIAVGKFDPARGTRFVTYAAHWIRAFILDHIIKNFSMVRVGGGQLRSKLFFGLRREKARIARETSDPVEATQKLADKFGTTPERITRLAQRLEARDVSVDAPVGSDTTATVLDTMASPLNSPESEFLSSEHANDLDHALTPVLSTLDKREKMIVQLRLMADKEDEVSLADLGRKLGISRERVRQLEVRVKAKIKRELKAWAELDQAA